MKFIIYLAYVGLLLLIIATVSLIILNWSEKLYSPLMSILFVGTLTTFITIFVMLKETREETTFTTLIVFDEEEHLPLFIIPNEENEKLTTKLSELSSLGRPVVGKGANLPLSIEKPKDFDETTTFGGELLQYKIVRDIYDLQRGGVGFSDMVGVGITSKVQTPYKLSETQKIPGPELLKILETNRFSNSTYEKLRLEHSALAIPRDTQLKLPFISSSEQTGPKKHIVSLEKPYYFTIEIIIEPFMGLNPGSLPKGLNLPPDKAQKCRTYVFKITMKARFEKYTAGNWRTEEYKEWVKWLFAGIRERLED